MDFDLGKKIFKLFTRSQSEPFFLHLSRNVKKIPTDQIPTAGVRINPDTGLFEMLYNPTFMGNLTDAQLGDVYKHELYHLIYMHVTDRLPDEGLTKRWNVATDLAINSFLSDLPEGCLRAGQEGTPWQNVPSHQTAEWYMANIEWPEGGGGGDGDGEGRGDHSGWGGASPHAREMARERLKQELKEAATKANTQSQGWGTVSHEMRKRIQAMLVPRVDWKSVLRYFIKTSQKAHRRNSIKSINRRYPYIHPGRTYSRTAKIAISIDQSGSVGDDMLALFFTELNKLASLAEFTVIPFDTRVAEDKVYTWKKGKTRTWERVLSGGTCFNAPTKWVNERDFDGHICLTDMMAPKPVPSRCQRMWMTTERHANNPYFSTNERVIAIQGE